MLNKVQAHKIIKAATDGDATRALLTLVDLLTDPNSPEFDEKPAKKPEPKPAPEEKKPEAVPAPATTP